MITLFYQTAIILAKLTPEFSAEDTKGNKTC